MLPMGLAVIAGLSCTDPHLEPSPVRLTRDRIVIVSPVDQPLWGVRDAVVSNGTVWTLGSTAPFVQVFGPSIGWHRTFGRQGQGPSDLRSPYNLWTRESSGSLSVWDPGSSRILKFSTAGMVLFTHNSPTVGTVRSDIEEVTFGHPFRALRLSSGIIVPRYKSGVNHGADLWNGQLLLLREGGTDPLVVLDFARELPGAATALAATFLVPVPLWDHCTEDRIAVLDPIAGTLFIFSIGDKLPTAIDLPWESVVLSSQARLAYVESRVRAELGDRDVSQEEIRRYALEAVNRVQDLFPSHEPLGVDLRCAPGRVWIQEFDATAHPLGYGTQWRMMSTDTAVSQVFRVAFPTGFTPLRFSEAGATGLLTDSLGFQRVAKIEFSLDPAL